MYDKLINRNNQDNILEKKSQERIIEKALKILSDEEDSIKIYTSADILKQKRVKVQPPVGATAAPLC